MRVREVARYYRTSLSTVQYWLRRAAQAPLDAVDWADRTRRPHRTPTRIAGSIEDCVVRIRKELGAGDLGFIGASAIRDALLSTGDKVPSVRTIGRILSRRGVLDGRRRVRRAAPPPGWYLAEAAAARADIDHFDVIEDLRLEGGPLIDVLTGCSLWGGEVLARPAETVGALFVVEGLLMHWQRVGLPTYAQFDNDTRFQGGHNHPNVIGRVIRCCLALGVTPVFAVPGEQGFQNIAESFNGLWQRKVWQRFHHADLPALRACSDRFVTRYTQHRRRRSEQAPARGRFPDNFQLNLQSVPSGQIIYLRRTTEDGAVTLLGHRWNVDSNWPHRLVRVQVDLTHKVIRFFRLRRKEPTEQPFVKDVPYALPERRFSE